MQWERTYSPHEGEATAARADVARVISDARLGPGLLWEAAAITDELAANAITHAGTEFRVAVEFADGFVRIEVSDGDPRPPVLTVVGPEMTSGRGLVIVAALAVSWGFAATVRDGMPGKTVWAVLAITAVGVSPS